MTDRYSARGDCVTIHSDTKGRTRLIHAPVSTPYGPAIIVEAGEFLPELMIERRSDLRHSVLLDQRKYAGLDRGYCRVEPEYHPRLTLDLLFAIRIHQKRESDPVSTRRCLYDERQVALVLRLVEVFELLARVLLVPAQIEVPAIMDPLDFLPTEWELILDVERCSCVVGQFASRMLVPLQLCWGEAK